MLDRLKAGLCRHFLDCETGIEDQAFRLLKLNLADRGVNATTSRPL
jgi:hypothetical protein